MAGSTQELERFVHAALDRGQSRQAIEQALVTAGWTPEQVRPALVAYAESDFPIPVPRPRPYLSPREAFIYLVIFTTLYLSAFHLGALLFNLIDRAFPDATQQVEYFRLGPDLRWSLASVIIAFPVFLYLSWRNERALARHPAKRQSAVRRWLTYLTLFVAAVALICDLTTLVDHFLGGELTMRFMLKVIVAAIIAVVAFTYYLRDLRRDEVDA
ncbi:DUF5671 domain-containing protein [Luteibacter aegosomaticola]|uniref:DUF5671 domain-containing protein n=1 Tax=Luteibacter aegosomaticola TaxID=2911538 RepID=UPI001FFA31EB|nr:DUF5671 domain-containing protein [Luteibacter aegosomaticola]UPG91676.1 DUF5671 domain-containing protein [Luteibacter aegosomaticola]